MKRQTSTYSLGYMLFKSLIAYFQSKFMEQTEVSFPEKIGNYHYVSRFRKVGPRKTYALAIYENKEGQKAIAKMYSSAVKGMSYYSLLNEITIYTVLTNTVHRIGKKMPPQFKQIQIPQIQEVYEDKQVLISLVEYIDGTVTERLSPQRKLQLYFLMVDFLQFLGKNISSQEKKLIAKRTPRTYLILYPFLAIKAILTYPKSTLAVLRSIPVFISNVPVMINSSEQTLVHRDLHFMNIMQTKNGYALIDFQQCVFTEPLHELITTLRYWWKGWKDERFGQLLMVEMVKRYSKRKNFKALFQAYAINSVTHGLTGAGFSNKIINGWIDFLRFSTDPDFAKYQK